MQNSFTDIPLRCCAAIRSSHSPAFGLARLRLDHGVPHDHNAAPAGSSERAVHEALTPSCNKTDPRYSTTAAVRQNASSSPRAKPRTGSASKGGEIGLEAHARL